MQARVDIPACLTLLPAQRLRSALAKSLAESFNGKFRVGGGLPLPPASVILAARISPRRQSHRYRRQVDEKRLFVMAATSESAFFVIGVTSPVQQLR
jgi:hypothetical protein